MYIPCAVYQLPCTTLRTQYRYALSDDTFARSSAASGSVFGAAGPLRHDVRAFAASRVGCASSATSPLASAARRWLLAASGAPGSGDRIFGAAGLLRQDVRAFTAGRGCGAFSATGPLTGAARRWLLAAPGAPGSGALGQCAGRRLVASAPRLAAGPGRPDDWRPPEWTKEGSWRQREQFEAGKDQVWWIAAMLMAIFGAVFALVPACKMFSCVRRTHERAA